MKPLTKHPHLEEADFTEEQRLALCAWFDREVEDALAGRSAQEIAWREAMRLYEGIPRVPIRTIPIENAPNIEITLGAIATDAIYAHVIDLIYTISPQVTCRAVRPEDTDAVKSLQAFVNWGTASEWALRPASEHSLFDAVQLGTGAYYIPYVEHRKKTRSHRITAQGPMIATLPIEDLIVPGGSHGDVQRTRWVGVRWWLTAGELQEWAEAQDWDIEGVIPVGVIGWTRSKREQLGRTTSSARVSELYEVILGYGYFDIDDDGYQEDLLWAWDRASRKLLGVKYNPYDVRPIEVMRYQIRAHLFYGQGVMDMIRPYQEEATELHNQRVLNVLLANSRFWKAKAGSVPETMKVWPGKVQEMQSPEDLDPVAMADVYPSMPQAEAIVVSLAERRVGINELSMPRPSAVLGSRTPGITALSMLQQSNRRFTPAFDQMRNATSAAVRQCLYRYQEQLLAGNVDVEAHIIEVLGPERGQDVLRLLRDPNFDESVKVELTAATVSVNKEADRQNALMLVNVLGAYYEKTLQLVALAANPQTPPEVRDVARKIATSAGEIIDRTIRTFDQIRDPELFIIHVEEELDKIEGLSNQGMLGLQQVMQALTMGAGRIADGTLTGGQGNGVPAMG